MVVSTTRVALLSSEHRMLESIGPLITDAKADKMGLGRSG